MEFSVRKTQMIATINTAKADDFLWWNEINTEDSSVKQSFLIGLALLQNIQNGWDGIQFYFLCFNFTLAWCKSAF